MLYMFLGEVVDSMKVQAYWILKEGKSLSGEIELELQRIFLADCILQSNIYYAQFFVWP